MDGPTNPLASWRIAVESREPVYGVGRRPALSTRDTGSEKRRRQPPSIPLRPCLHLRLAASQRNASPGTRGDRPNDDPDRKGQGLERADVRRTARIEQGGNCTKIRGGPSEDLAAEL